MTRLPLTLSYVSAALELSPAVTAHNKALAAEGLASLQEQLAGATVVARCACADPDCATFFLSVDSEYDSSLDVSQNDGILLVVDLDAAGMLCGVEVLGAPALAAELAAGQLPVRKVE